MIANINKEYTSPNSAKARKQREKLNAQIQAFLNGGGVINEIPDYESTHYKPAIIDQTSNKTRQELAAARKKGKKKMSKGVAA
jgi:hypothetical protein